jgi:transcriptional regulator with PAS, ATPase and Fis domain
VTSDSDRGTTKLLPRGGDAAPALLIVSDGVPKVIPLKAGKALTIGRAETADVVLDDSSLSRHHAAFYLTDDAIEVEDLDSSNGTSVRGEQLKPHERRALEIGEAVHLGRVLVVIQLREGSVADRVRPAASALPSDELVTRIAASTMSVMILGETGVGKEVMAERLHALSPRSAGPLVKINCGALMSSVLESELFGYEKGSFTGAVKDKAGLIESADGGTLFLDEIGEADANVQVKLLRVLEAKESMRIGALRPRIVDVRFLAATNRVPSEQVKAGTLRADLYYRLAGFTITIPPLRDRRTRIPGLAKDLLARHAGFSLHQDAVARLVAHDWPGNVRELRNVLDRAVVLSPKPVITAAVVDAAISPDVTDFSGDDGGDEDAELIPGLITDASAHTGDQDPERARVLAVLAECGGNQSVAAERLGISRRTLVYRLQSWGLTKKMRRR